MSDLVLHILLIIVAGTALVMLPLLLGRLVRPDQPTPEKEAIYECGEPTIGTSYIQFDLRFYTVALLFIIFDVEVAFFFPWATVYGGTMQMADQQLDAASRVAVASRVLSRQDAAVTPDRVAQAAQATQSQYEALISSAEFTGRVRKQLAEELAASEELKQQARAALQADGQDEPSEQAVANEAAALAQKQLEDSPELEAALADARVDAQVDLIAAQLGVDAARVRQVWISPSTARDLGVLALFDILVFFGVLLVGFAYVWKRGDLEWVRSIRGQTPLTAASSPVADSSAAPVSAA